MTGSRGLRTIKIGDKIIEEKDELIFLGVIIDNKLKFKSHFNKVYDKVKKGLNGLLMAKNYLDYRSKLNIYHSLIHSHLSYCALIWLSSITKKQLQTLKTLQKKAIRIIYNLRYNAHTDKYFEISKITKVDNIFEKDSLLLTHKFHMWKLPKAIIKLFNDSIYDPNRLTRSQTSCVYKLKRNLKDGVLMHDIIKNWNNIDKSLRDEINYIDFKSKITKMLNRYIDCDKENCYVCKRKG